MVVRPGAARTQLVSLVAHAPVPFAFPCCCFPVVVVRRVRCSARPTSAVSFHLATHEVLPVSTVAVDVLHSVQCSSPDQRYCGVSAKGGHVHGVCVERQRNHLLDWKKLFPTVEPTRRLSFHKRGEVTNRPLADKSVSSASSPEVVGPPPSGQCEPSQLALVGVIAPC